MQRTEFYMCGTRVVSQQCGDNAVNDTEMTMIEHIGVTTYKYEYTH